MTALVPLWRILRELRIPYFAAIALPILLGSAAAWARSGQLDVGLFFLSLLAGIFLQAGTTITHDLFATPNATEQAAPSFLPPEQVVQGALAFFVVGAMVGLYVALASGPLVLLLGVIGIASGYVYSVPSWRLGGTGLGEGLAGLNLGLLTTVGASYVQAGRVDGWTIWAALPVACLMSAVLVLNGFRTADRAAAPTLWQRLGQARAAPAYGAPALLGYALLIVAVALRSLPPLTLLGLLSVPLAALAIVSARWHRLSLALAGAVGAHLSMTALLALAFVLHGLLAP